MNNIYPKDQEYRKVLADYTGCNSENLASIMGLEELQHVLSILKPEDFSIGDVLNRDFTRRFKKVLNGTFKISLHSHTQDSDGKLTIHQLLDQAVIYADKASKFADNSEIPPFTIAITNHDIIQDVQEAARIVSINPEKFKNLRLILGAELSAIYDNEKFLKTAIHFDSVAYCINPFDPELNNFLDTMRQNRFNCAQGIIDRVNSWSAEVSLDKAKKAHKLIEIGSSNGFFEFFKQYLIKRMKENGLWSKYKYQLDEMFTGKLNENTYTISEIVSAIDKNGFGMMGLAHPGKIKLSRYLKSENIKEHNHRDKNEHGMYLLLKNLKEIGVKACEVNYQYTEQFYDFKTHKLNSWISNTNKSAKELGLFETGGTDSHENNIFLHHEDLTRNQTKILESVN